MKGYEIKRGEKMNRIYDALMDDFIDSAEVISSTQFSGREFGSSYFLRGLQSEENKNGDEKCFQSTTLNCFGSGADDFSKQF